MAILLVSVQINIGMWLWPQIMRKFPQTPVIICNLSDIDALFQQSMIGSPIIILDYLPEDEDFVPKLLGLTTELSPPNRTELYKTGARVESFVKQELGEALHTTNPAVC